MTRQALVGAMIVALAIAVAACVGLRDPDLVIFNAKIFTADPAFPWAQAVAIKGGRVTAVGDSEFINAFATSRTRSINAGGRTIVPGFNDAHQHIVMTPPFEHLDLPLDPSLAQMAEAVKAVVATASAGRLIQGEFFDTAWGDPGFTRGWLDGLAPNHPVWLTAFTGHGALLNSKALALVDIDEAIKDPDGGRFYRDASGRLNGRLEEYAQSIANRRLTLKTPPEERVRIYRQFAKDAAAFGITSTQLLGDYMPPGDAAKALVDANANMRWRYFRFPIFQPAGDTLDSRPALPPQPTAMIDMRGMKFILDGTPIERLGYMRAPYADAPSSRGTLNLSPQRIDQFVGWAYGSEDPLAVHAFGDGAIEAYVSAVERGGKAEVWREKRPRIEHGDMMAPDLIPRVKAMGLLVVQNPTHFTFPEVFLARYGKERLAWMQPMKSLLDAGIPLAIGSDGPMNPFLNIMAASTHPTNPKEALTREQAVMAYTAGSAFAEFQEKNKGQLMVGKLADLAILSADVFTVPVSEMESIRSVMTILGGRIVHDTGVVH